MDSFIDKSPLAVIDTKALTIAFVIAIFVALLIAYRYRNTYKVSNMLKAYGVFSVVFSVVFLIFKVKIVLIIGVLLSGLVVLAFRSNHYFYN